MFTRLYNEHIPELEKAAHSDTDLEPVQVTRKRNDRCPQVQKQDPKTKTNSPFKSPEPVVSQQKIPRGHPCKAQTKE